MMPIDNSGKFKTRTSTTGFTMASGAYNYGTTTDTTANVIYFDSYALTPEPLPTEDIDQRLNPKFWAKWFKEFLDELFDEPRNQDGGEIPLRAGESHTTWLTKQFRRYLPRAEWKWKNWCQALEVS